MGRLEKPKYTVISRNTPQNCSNELAMDRKYSYIVEALHRLWLHAMRKGLTLSWCINSLQN
jgi:hypothetical protein